MTDIPQTDWVYDIETYLDLFSVDMTHVASRTRYIFEVSERRDHGAALMSHLNQLKDAGHRMFGFRNTFFDWPILQRMINTGIITAEAAHLHGNAIIADKNQWNHVVWQKDCTVPQGDLYRIHHFDNMARATSLKKLEINMRSKTVVDLPYPPDQPTTWEQKDEIVAYMNHDVAETLKFYLFSLDQIKFRDELAAKYPDMYDVLNMNDTKIGKQFFIKQLEQRGTQCFHRRNGRKEPEQTWRAKIAMKDVISPKVHFRHPEFLRVKQWLEEQTLTSRQIDDSVSPVETKGVFTGLSASIDGFGYDFGTGGIHGSLHDKAVREDQDWEIWDWDVASFYPNLGISNRFYPAHLSERFCDIYEEVYQMRKSYKKGTAENAMLKLALNGVYGDSNNKYSAFYDPQYTMSITVNGQLLLCMLAEWLTQVPTADGDMQSNDVCQMVQINTDGLTVRIRKSHVAWMKEVCAYWEQATGLELESVQYRSMFIRDVNSYIAVKMDGKVKRIGAYAYETPHDDLYTRERGWHKDHSMLVIRKAAEAQMVHGVPVEDFVKSHRDPFDFCLTAKVNRSANGKPCRLWHGDRQIQNTSRYYVSKDGHHLRKEMTKKNATEPSMTDMQSGWTTTIVNDMDHFDWSTVNWMYYIEEARKLVIE